MSDTQIKHNLNGIYPNLKKDMTRVAAAKDSPQLLCIMVLSGFIQFFYTIRKNALNKNPFTNVPSLHNKNKPIKEKVRYTNRSLKNMQHCLVLGVWSHNFF